MLVVRASLVLTDALESTNLFFLGQEASADRGVGKEEDDDDTIKYKVARAPKIMYNRDPIQKSLLVSGRPFLLDEQARSHT